MDSEGGGVFFLFLSSFLGAKKKTLKKDWEEKSMMRVRKGEKGGKIESSRCP